jgi:hypothetical protein
MGWAAAEMVGVVEVAERRCISRWERFYKL